MKIHQIYINNSLRNFNYIIQFGDNKAIIIDPMDTDVLIDFIESNNLDPLYIINTHEHFDHTGGNIELQDKYDLDVMCSTYAESVPGKNRELDEGDIIELEDNVKLKVIYTPGHTYGHITLQIFEKENCTGIISGDTLFNAGVGNCRSGDPNTLFESFENFFYKLDDNVKIYPGHDYFENNLNFSKTIEPDNNDIEVALKKYQEERDNGKYFISTIGDEKKYNCFFRLDKKKVKDKLGGSKLSKKELFSSLRKLRDSW